MSQPPPHALLEERLEHDEVASFPVAPFPLPRDDDRAFLLRQSSAGPTHKSIHFDPHTGRLTGHARAGSEGERQRLCRLLASFAEDVSAWMVEALPSYRGGLASDRVSYRPEEEATRPSRPNARNDLLHIDAFPNRPARGRRILRVFANLDPVESRVWATADPLPRLLARLPDDWTRPGWMQGLGDRLLALLRSGKHRPAASDRLMRRLHDRLKADHDFQQRSPRRLWRFPPGSAWLAMTDGCCYAELRGRHILEASYFVAPAVLRCPDLAPAVLLGRAA